MNKYWYGQRNYGWGWKPISWEGWLLLGVFLYLIYLKKDLEFIKLLPYLIGYILIVAYKSQEKFNVKWKWG